MGLWFTSHFDGALMHSFVQPRLVDSSGSLGVTGDGVIAAPNGKPLFSDHTHSKVWLSILRSDCTGEGEPPVAGNGCSERSVLRGLPSSCGSESEDAPLRAFEVVNLIPQPKPHLPSRIRRLASRSPESATQVASACSPQRKCATPPAKKLSRLQQAGSLRQEARDQRTVTTL